MSLARDFYARWLAGDRTGVVDDLAYLDRRPALLAAVELAGILDDRDQAQLLRRLRVKLADFG